MKDYINIGPVPAAEPCVPIGDPNYMKESRKECNRFKQQLIRQFGNPPTGASLGTKEFHHDFGIYHEIVCYFEVNNVEAENYCYEMESNIPEFWED